MVGSHRARIARALIATSLAALALACPPAAAAACDAPLEIAGAQRSIRQGGPAAPVPVPDRLGRELRGEDTQLRYRLDVSACAAAPSAAFWLFRAGAPYAIRDDAGRPLQLLSTAGRLPAAVLALAADAPVHNGRIPALYGLPPGTRQVEIELLAIPYIPAGVVRVAVGPTNQLLPLQAGALKNVVAFADEVSGIVLVLGTLALVLWLQRRRDHTLLWLAVACGLWGVRGLAYFGPLAGMPPVWFEQFNSINVLLTSGAISASVFALLGVLTPRRARLVAAGTALGTLALVGSVLAGRGGVPARALGLLVGFCMVSWLVAAVWRRRGQLLRWRALTLLAGLAGLVLCAVHDLMVIAGGLPPDSPSYIFWGFAALLVGFAALSAQYVVATLNRAERSNEELEHHVRAKSAELERSYAQLRDRDREAARVHERERLLRDMHDGLGAQLMTVLRGVERDALGREQLAASLQDSLDELRLLMDSADMADYLPGALAAWRNRWDHRLQAAGIALEWRIAESVDGVRLTGPETLQVMRILQEAATNVVKHAQATRMELRAHVLAADGPGPAMFELAVSDDGIGLPAGPRRSGSRGLGNMQHRSREIGAELLARARQPGPGTEVLLRLPLPQDTSPRRAASIAASARDEMPSLR